ncbi:MAG: DUF4349 domain-containing protein [Chitinophagaceae bacterium]
MSLKQQFRKYFRWCLFAFVLLFGLRLLYGYLATATGVSDSYGDDFFSSVQDLRKNYATEKKLQTTNIDQRASVASEQKYEKTATVRTKSTSFEQDENRVNNVVRDFNAVVQYEQQMGNKGSREVHLLLGIAPDKFDSFYVQVQTIGQVRSREITKVDKTNEFRELNAKKASLETTLASLNELRSRGGAISDYVSLHDKILEIESRLQELGVALGNFDAENQFCTVKFSLYEGAPEKKISLLQRIKVALEWTIQYYALLAIGIAGAALAVFVILLIVDKLQVIASRGK